jgi:hypothetical protein
MALLDDIEAAWTPEHVVTVEGWAADLEKNLSYFAKASKQFKVTSPLDVYLTVSRAKQSTARFSIRFLGQEVAELLVKEDISLAINKKLAGTNKKYFEIAEQGVFLWNSARGIAFRKHFKAINQKSTTVGVLEHRIEAEFLKQMARGDRGKFAGTLAGIQPISLAGCRFQFPLPISASTGKPKSSRGNIDILARRGNGRGTRLSVWELKAPDTMASSIEQAYIYAVTLLKMLRSPSGGFWYQQVFGFKGDVPKKLTVESVVAVSFSSESKKQKFEAKFDAFSQSAELRVGEDMIKLCFAYYDYKPSSLKMEFMG